HPILLHTHTHTQTHTHTHTHTHKHTHTHTHTHKHSPLWTHKRQYHLSAAPPLACHLSSHLSECNRMSPRPWVPITFNTSLQGGERNTHTQSHTHTHTYTQSYSSRRKWVCLHTDST